VGFSGFDRWDLIARESLDFYHPNMQAVAIGAAAVAGRQRGARVVELV